MSPKIPRWYVMTMRSMRKQNLIDQLSDVGKNAIGKNAIGKIAISKNAIGKNARW